MQALADEGHETPTPIQIAAIPALLGNRDVLGIAQTGSGKTAAFALPILHRLAATHRLLAPRECRALVLTPTRELAVQVLSRFKAYGKRLPLNAGLAIGGVPINRQKRMMQAGVDVLVATPGRLCDLVQQKAASLEGVETFVLDEVDQMLDLGFIPAIRSIASKLPNKRQNVFFSATLAPQIARLAGGLLNDPTRVEIKGAEPPKIDQSVLFITPTDKLNTLLGIVRSKEFTRGLVFTRTKRGADKVVRGLAAAGAAAAAIHGNRSQNQRERALKAFRNGKTPILVATDIAARGIDIPDVSHVINFDLPNTPETYVHRIGRTARAGASGVGVSFCTDEERPYLRAIERLTGRKIAVLGTKAPDSGDQDGQRRDAKVRRRRKRSTAGRTLSRAV